MIIQKDQLIKRIESLSLALKKYINEKETEPFCHIRDEAVSEFNKSSILDFETICSMDNNSFGHFAAIESTERDPKKLYIAHLLLSDILALKSSGEIVPEYKLEKLSLLKNTISGFESDDVQEIIKIMDAFEL